MEILIVEDDEYKVRALSAFLSEAIPHAHIDEAHSVSSGEHKIESRNFDLIVLDMSLPTFDISPTDSGGRPQGFGGIEILRFLDALQVQTRVILISQYPEFSEGGSSTDLKSLAERLKLDFSDHLSGWVFYDHASDRWKAELSQLIKRVVPGTTL